MLNSEIAFILTPSTVENNGLAQLFSLKNVSCFREANQVVFCYRLAQAQQTLGICKEGRGGAEKRRKQSCNICKCSHATYLIISDSCRREFLGFVSQCQQESSVGLYLVVSVGCTLAGPAIHATCIKLVWMCLML